MKKKLLYIAVVAICLAMLSGGTLAYFTTTDTARNVITSGAVEVKVVEQQLVNGTLSAYPDEPIQIMPGAVVSKIVSVQSVEQAVWVRMRYSVTVYDADGSVMNIPAEELNKVIQIPAGGEEWTFVDGWWYYNAAVASGELTQPLFEQVVFAGAEMGNEYQNCTVEIDVTAQAVQQANNGTTVMEAVGWPE